MKYYPACNLTNDGGSPYAWNARNQLVSIGGPVAASFQYDAFGRRISGTIGSTSKSYLYDLINPIQELSGGRPIANMLTGLGVDEVLERTDSSGGSNFLILPPLHPRLPTHTPTPA